MCESSGTHVWSSIARLKSKTIHDSHVPENHSSRRFLGPLNIEFGTFETKFVGGIFMQHQRKNLLFQKLVTVSPIFTAIHEDVEFSRVGMEVTVHSYTALLHKLFDHHLGLVDRRKCFLKYEIWWVKNDSSIIWRQMSFLWSTLYKIK